MSVPILVINEKGEQVGGDFVVAEIDQHETFVPKYAYDRWKSECLEQKQFKYDLQARIEQLEDELTKVKNLKSLGNAGYDLLLAIEKKKLTLAIDTFEAIKKHEINSSVNELISEALYVIGDK